MTTNVQFNSLKKYLPNKLDTNNIFSLYQDTIPVHIVKAMLINAYLQGKHDALVTLLGEK